jgi:xanthine dehydrogenase accessory factor
VLELIRTIANIVENGREVVTATIVGHAGSAPRGAGGKMLVWPDGAIAGSVGGGLLEAKVLRKALELFTSGGAEVMEFDLTGDEAAKSGMICGGAVTVLLEHVRPDEASSGVYEQAAAVMDSGRKAVLATVLSKADGGLRVADRLVLMREGLEYSTGERPPEEIPDIAAECEEAGLVEADGRLYALEPLALPNAAIIVGAGHVGLFTARTASLVGFRTVVLDDRAEFADRRRFPDADEVLVVDSFEHCFDDLEIDETSFIVILTRGHAHDKTVLAEALSTRAGYVGMIGSCRKRDAIYEALAAEGVPRGKLESVHSPIGLSIEAKTPEEIAVSITAEMIRVRAGMRK